MSANGTASLELMASLHAMLTETFIDDLRWYREQGIPVPAAEKAATAKFLKDNAITCDPADAADIEALRQELTASLSEKRRKALSKTLDGDTASDLAALYGFDEPPKGATVQ
jgi:hypothetical protein